MTELTQADLAASQAISDASPRCPIAVALAPLKLEITQADIDGGKRCSNNSCPVALALLRQVPDCVYVSVAMRGALIYKRGPRRTPVNYLLTHGAWAFIRAFDAGEPVSPCTIELLCKQ